MPHPVTLQLHYTELMYTYISLLCSREYISKGFSSDKQIIIYFTRNKLTVYVMLMCQVFSPVCHCLVYVCLNATTHISTIFTHTFDIFPVFILLLLQLFATNRTSCKCHKLRSRFKKMMLEDVIEFFCSHPGQLSSLRIRL